VEKKASFEIRALESDAAGFQVGSYAGTDGGNDSDGPEKMGNAERRALDGVVVIVVVIAAAIAVVIVVVDAAVAAAAAAVRVEMTVVADD